MSTDHILTGDADGALSGTERAETCRAPNCWRDGRAVPVEEDERYPECRAYRCGAVTIVVDGTDDVVKTVVKEVAE